MTHPIPTPIDDDHDPRTGTSVVARGKVVVVGMDGVRLDTLRSATTPGLDSLQQQGFLRAVRVNDAGITISGPGWATITTGVLTDRHLVRDNDFDGNALDRWPDFVTRVRDSVPGAKTLAVAGWSPLTTSDSGGPMFPDAELPADRPPHTFEEWEAADERAAERTCEVVADAPTDAAVAIFCYLGLPDEVCHSVGVVDRYRASIEHADRQLVRVLDAIGGRPDAADWTVIAVTDHGHVDAGGHGGETEEERTAWIAARGPGLEAGKEPASLEQADVAAHALAAVGVDITGLDLFGTPFHTRR